MNTLDYAIVGAAIFGSIYGVSRGVLRMATSAASLAAGVYFATAYHSAGGAMAERALGNSVGSMALAVLGYIVVFAIVFAGVETAGSILIRLMHIVHLSWADRLGGGVIGGAVASLFASFGVLLLTAILQPDAPLLRDSQLAPHVLAYNQVLLSYVPVEVRDAYQVRRDALVHYWVEHAIVPGLTPAPAPSAGIATK
jgi:membrane protein required for colicin V production